MWNCTGSGSPHYEECGTDEERWCWTLKNMGRMVREPGRGDTLLLPELEHLLESGMIAGFSKEKRAKYDADMITERDMYNILETAKQEGEAKGHEAGLAEGKAEAALQIARNLLASGMPKDQVIFDDRPDRRTALRACLGADFKVDRHKLLIQIAAVRQ